MEREKEGEEEREGRDGEGEGGRGRERRERERESFVVVDISSVLRVLRLIFCRICLAVLVF